VGGGEVDKWRRTRDEGLYSSFQIQSTMRRVSEL
jgi:hypothetical protein